jgi:hypothetical protein
VTDKDAIDLTVILLENCDVEIIADIRYLNRDHKLFFGGVVDQKFSSPGRVCIANAYGSAYIDRAHAIGGQEAMHMIFGRCPR